MCYCKQVAVDTPALQPLTELAAHERSALGWTHRFNLERLFLREATQLLASFFKAHPEAFADRENRETFISLVQLFFMNSPVDRETGKNEQSPFMQNRWMPFVVQAKQYGDVLGAWQMYLQDLPKKAKAVLLPAAVAEAQEYVSGYKLMLPAWVVRSETYPSRKAAAELSKTPKYHFLRGYDSVAAFWANYAQRDLFLAYMQKVQEKLDRAVTKSVQKKNWRGIQHYLLWRTAVAKVKATLFKDVYEENGITFGLSPKPPSFEEQTMNANAKRQLKHQQFWRDFVQTWAWTVNPKAKYIPVAKIPLSVALNEFKHSFYNYVVLDHMSVKQAWTTCMIHWKNNRVKR